MTNLNSTASSQNNDVLEGLAATLGVNIADFSPTELMAAAQNRIQELTPLANSEETFDAYQLEQGMLEVLLAEAQNSFGEEQGAPKGATLH